MCKILLVCQMSYIFKGILKNMDFINSSVDFFNIKDNHLSIYLI